MNSRVKKSVTAIILTTLAIFSLTTVLCIDSDAVDAPHGIHFAYYVNSSGGWSSTDITSFQDSSGKVYFNYVPHYGTSGITVGFSANQDGTGQIYYSGQHIYSSIPDTLYEIYNNTGPMKHVERSSTFDAGDCLYFSVVGSRNPYFINVPDWMNTQEKSDGMWATGVAQPGTYTFKYYDMGDTYTHTFTVVSKDHTVSFSSEGSVIHTETVEPDTKVQSYTPPAREGYTFGGWYTDTNFQTPFDFNTQITSDITLYAKWVENPVTITFMVEGSVYSTLVVPKGSVGVVYTPIMVTGVFAGWYYDSALTQKYDATRSLDADITLYACGVPPLIFTSEPNATANIQQVNSYNLFFFDATDSSGRYQIEWDFGDGNTSTDAIAYNTYSAPGLYTVTLKITNIYGETSTATYDVLVKDPAGGGENDLRLIVIALLCILGGGLVIRRFL